MKLFNVENGKEKVYVQLQDIMELMNGEMGHDGFPASIIDKLFSSGEALFVSDHNRWDFVQFDKPEDVEYFRQQKWILDIKSVRGLTFEGLQEHAESIAKKHDAIAMELRELSQEELKTREDDIRELAAYKNIFDTLPELSHTLRGFKKMNFPVVVDSDGYDCGSNEEYEAKSSLDPSKIIIRRKDGQPLNKGKLTRQYLKSVIANGAVGMSEARATYCTVGRAKQTISEDGKEIIITYTVTPILMKEEAEFKKNNTFVKRMKRKLSGQPEIME